MRPNIVRYRWLAVLAFAVSALVFASPPEAAGGAWSFRLNLGGFPEPVWQESDLKLLVRRVRKDMDEALKEAEKTGRILQAPPVPAFPGWSRCQDIAHQARPDLMVVRMNLAGLKAAVKMVRGTFDRMSEDRFEEGLPFGFSAGDWGAEILRDFRLRGCSKKRLLRILTIHQGAARDLWADLRDDINRDVVWTHHAWEKTKNHPDTATRNRAAWNLWHAMGFPARW
ncbi:MAG TPA: hypothetical protein PLU72_05655 [Candidatus Ozemobacteraceae bacterium]|nr:hypothetical protein [Candidatus Ozemobacteraceae bacterium]HQG27228.1 hypothetical protein [Candidatus Ozemobacteraceae bacterium]